MKLTRRELVVAGLTVSLGNAFKMNRLQAASEDALPSPMTVAITGIIPETHPSRLAAFQNPFLALRIPVTVCVRPTNGTGSPLAPRSKLAHNLRAMLDANPDLFEVAIDAKEFGSDDPYFQLRQASDAQSALTRSLNPVGDFHRQSLFTAQTLLTTTTSMGREHLACLRAAGIRTVIHVPAAIEAEQPVVAAGYWMTSTHLAKTFALAATSAQAGAEGPRRPINEMRAGLQAEAAQRNPITVHISFAAFDDLNQDGLSQYAHALAQLLSGMRDDGSVRLLLPYTLYRQTTRGPAQYIIVRVDALRARGSDRAHRNFTMKLLEAGIPVSESVMPSRYDARNSEPLATDSEAKRYLENALLNPGYDIAIRGTEHTSKELALGALEHNSAIIPQSMREIYATAAMSPTAYISPDEIFDEDVLVRIAECGIRMLSTEPGSNQLTWGLGQTGLLNILNSVRFERPLSTDLPKYDSAEMLRVIGSRNDAVLIIRPPTVSSPESLQKISDVLSALSAQNGTRLVNFSQYYKAVVPKMPLVEIIREARMQRLIIDPSFPIAEAVSVDDLKADARIAWRYFDRMSVKNTGLVLGTAWEIMGKIEGYAFATMWDLGSLVMAYCSAYKLELIDQTRFEVGTRGIIEFLGQSFFRYRDALLPNTERAIAKGPTPRDGFDAIDTGRLLIGLKRLDNLTARSLPIESLVKKWDFNAVLAEGEMHNITPSGLKSVHESSYALYAARGYNLWGWDLKPVFAVERPTANMDNTLIFLTEVARRGAVATEPWTTEHIELSPSEYTTIIEDVLYAAQIRRRADTGYMTSVSEMAIDHDPWFIYQGYQIDLDGGTWRVDTSTANARFANEEFVASNRAVSSKGAFLWLATRPGEYTANLYRHVREKCRTDNLGFSSGIYERSGVPSKLSDVNSNGLILEAIEYMLSAQSPLLHRL